MASKLTGPAKRAVKLLLFALVVHLFVIPQIGGARNAHARKCALRLLRSGVHALTPARYALTLS